MIQYSAPACFKAKDLPEAVWKGNLLLLPETLSNAHRDECTARGWFHEYSPTEEGSGAVGGSTAMEAKRHFINRFLNSAARSEYVCADPLDQRPEIRDMILEQFGEGRICIIDLAAGHGAGTLAILSLLAALRSAEKLPKLPLNVVIFGIDYSADALNLYSETLGRLETSLQSQGIDVTLTLYTCDLMVAAELSETLDSIFDAAQKDGICRFFCVLSAISGVGKDSMEQIQDSLKIVAARLGSKKRHSSWLWLEPSASKGWLAAIGHSVALVMRGIRHTFFRKGDTFEVTSEVPLVPEVVRKFRWRDPHTSTTVLSHVLVMAFNN